MSAGRTSVASLRNLATDRTTARNKVTGPWRWHGWVRPSKITEGIKRRDHDKLA